VLDEVSAVVEAYGGVSYPRLERSGMQWPVSGFGADQSVFLSVGNGLVAENVRVVAD
jgi:predicted molibdopterin-dependent oxidoreductase YjgC